MVTKFEEINLYNEKLHAIIFGAKWCNPCKQLKENIIKLEKNDKIGKYDILYVDIEICDNDLLSFFGIRGIPVIVMFDEKSNVVEHLVGYMSEEKLKKMFLDECK
jgi:thioredoxin-like negative regulator of GroEL